LSSSEECLGLSKYLQNVGAGAQSSKVIVFSRVVMDVLGGVLN